MNVFSWIINEIRINWSCCFVSSSSSYSSSSVSSTCSHSWYTYTGKSVALIKVILFALLVRLFTRVTASLKQHSHCLSLHSFPSLNVISFYGGKNALFCVVCCVLCVLCALSVCVLTFPPLSSLLLRTKDTRTHIVGELYETEKSYVESLDILVNVS